MQIENHKEEVPFSYYADQWKDLLPEDAVSRLGVKWDGKEFYVNLFGRALRLSHPEYAIRAEDEKPLPSLPVQTFLLRYLLGGKAVSWQGQWKTFREMPWGELYIQPYTGRVLTRAAFTFGTKLEKFKAACEKMGATPVSHGDAGFCFTVIGNYQMQILVWEGDEEFPPNVQILYSDNFAQGFEAEDRVVAGDLLINAIRGNM